MYERRRFSAEKKAEILREHYKNKLAITEICSKYGINPSIFYRWEKQLLEGAIGIFSGNHTKQSCTSSNMIGYKYGNISWFFLPMLIFIKTIAPMQNFWEIYCIN